MKKKHKMKRGKKKVVGLKKGRDKNPPKQIEPIQEEPILVPDANLYALAAYILFRYYFDRRVLLADKDYDEASLLQGAITKFGELRKLSGDKQVCELIVGCLAMLNQRYLEGTNPFETVWLDDYLTKIGWMKGKKQKSKLGLDF